jgi:hypothetical protein
MRLTDPRYQIAGGVTAGGQGRTQGYDNLLALMAGDGR